MWYFQLSRESRPYKMYINFEFGSLLKFWAPFYIFGHCTVRVVIFFWWVCFSWFKKLTHMMIYPSQIWYCLWMLIPIVRNHCWGVWIAFSLSWASPFGATRTTCGRASISSTRRKTPSKRRPATTSSSRTRPPLALREKRAQQRPARSSSSTEPISVALTNLEFSFTRSFVCIMCMCGTSSLFLRRVKIDTVKSCEGVSTLCFFINCETNLL